MGRIKCWKKNKCGWEGTRDDLKPVPGKKIAGIDSKDLVCPICGAKTTLIARCKIKGLVAPGVMCGKLIVRDKTCSWSEKCIHQQW